MIELSQSRCLVIGGGGFIGTNLCRALSGKVQRLRAFGRRQVFPAAMQGIDWYQGDLVDHTALTAAIEGFDTVIHLANTTTPASANADKAADVHGNVLASLGLLDACRQAQVQRLVFISSGGTVYGIPEAIPTPETASTWPITAYGISKLTVEKYIAMYRHMYGLECAILRVANPFGPFQTAARDQGVIAAFLSRALVGKSLEIWGDGSVVRDYLYIDDVVSAIEAAISYRGPEYVFNIGYGEGRSLNQVILAIGEVLGRRIEVDYGSARSLDVPASVLDISRARAHLGWAPETDFRDGLARAAEWMAGFRGLKA